MDHEYNLLEERWIKVRSNNETIEVSLKDALLHAHEYQDLAGELPTQDAAVLRLLLAVLFTVFSRFTAEGEAEALENDENEDAINRWIDLWNMKQFPSRPIEQYLDEWKHRFWLFDEKYPFWQVPEAARAKQYKSFKLSGDMLESENKARLFPVRYGIPKHELSYAEAARWLLYLNAWDDTALKKTRGITASASVGWLGRLGYIAAIGANLFETLMLNLTFLKDGDQSWDYDDCIPAWELDMPRTAELSEIPAPEHPAALLTLQSRRILLAREHDKVIGYHLLSGDYFSAENAFTEQYTLWKSFQQKGTGVLLYSPKLHDPQKQLWRDFSAIAEQSKQTRQPGVVRWIAQLKKNSDCDLCSNDVIRFKTAAICYDGSASHTVQDSFSDSLSFHAELLTEVGKTWRDCIEEEISKIEETASLIGYLSDSLCKASGMSTEGKGADTLRDKADHSRAQFYARVDLPFRVWLESLKPEMDTEEPRTGWQQQARRIAIELGKEMVFSADPAAFVGRSLTEKRKNNKGKNVDMDIYYSSPEAYNRFQRRLNKIYSIKKEV